MRALVEKFPDGLREGLEQEHGDWSEGTKHSGELQLDSEILAGETLCDAV